MIMASVMKGLNELNPSQRKNFTGLNDTIADDLNGFKSLENVIINFLVQKKKTLLDWSTQRDI